MHQDNSRQRRFSLRSLFDKVRNAGVSYIDSPPRARGLRFMNLSTLVAGLLVLVFGVVLGVISRQYTIVILAILVSFLFLSVLVFNYIKDYIAALGIWQLTFCISTYVFGILEREVIDATHMIPFLVAAPAFVLWKADYRTQTLPGCILLAILTYVGMEFTSALNLIPALPLKDYYWYFRPATLVTIYSLNIMVFWKLLKEMDGVFAKLAKSIQDEQQAKIKVERYAEQMQLYASIITHEIKSPLSALKSIAGAFQQAATSDDRTSYISRADACVSHLQAIVDNAQFLAKLDAGDPPVMANETFSIRALISELVSFYSFEAEKRRLKIIYNCDTETPPYIQGDAQCIRQVVINLVSNAIKFSKKNTTIFVRVSSVSDRCHVSVEDQGEGIAPSSLNKIFEKFYSTKDQNRKGVGIGLFVSNKLAGYMKGKLKVESTVGRGSIFTLSLPLYTANIPLPEERNWSGYRIEIIEDAVFLGEITAERLEKFGFSTANALTGEEGIEVALEFKPHLILLDFSLPDMDGHRVVDKLSSHPQLAQTPVIILSGESQDELHKRVLLYRENVVGYIQKPLGKSGIDQIITFFESIT